MSAKKQNKFFSIKFESKRWYLELAYLITSLIALFANNTIISLIFFVITLALIITQGILNNKDEEAQKAAKAKAKEAKAKAAKTAKPKPAKAQTPKKPAKKAKK